MAKIYRIIQENIESISSRKCPHDHWLTNKAFQSAITVTNIFRSFYLQDGGKNRLEQNYVTVALCSWDCYKAVERLVQCRTVAFRSARVSLSQNMRTCLFVLRRAAASHLSTLHYKLSSQCPPRTHTQCTLANNLLCHGSTRLELPCWSMEIEN